MTTRDPHPASQTVSTFTPPSCVFEQQELVSSLEEKLRSARSSQQEVQLHCSQQKQTISELQAKNSQQSVEMDGLRRRVEELQQVTGSKTGSVNCQGLELTGTVTCCRICRGKTRRRWPR